MILHRWAGLTIASFLVVAGLTGAVLPWSRQLTWLSAPALFAASPPTPGARRLPGDLLAEIVQRRTGGFVYAPLDADDRHAVEMFVSAKPGDKPLPFDQMVVDPYSGAIRASYRFGHLQDGPQTIMSFLVMLHFSLAAGEWGRLAFGIAALVWTIDCFVGFYLTLPLGRPAGQERRRASAWLTRWRPAWAVRRGAGGYRLNVDLHRAGGLWLWPVLLVFAWSSFSMNLPQVHDPMMRLLGEGGPSEVPVLAAPPRDPVLGPVAAAAAGRRALIARGRRDGFTFTSPSSIFYAPDRGAYRYIARTSLDWSSEGGGTIVWLSGRDGHVLRFDPPMPPGVAAQIDRWSLLLHLAVFGLPYRIFVSFVGVAVAGLSVTGVVIWLKKRGARILAGRTRAGRHAAIILEALPAE